MTRNDYERLARGLARAWESAKPGPERMGVAMAAAAVADVLEGDNARFDRVRFLRAVMAAEKVNGS